MILLICIAYAIVWLMVLFLLKMLKGRYLETPSQRNNAITVLHAIFSPIITLIYVFSWEDITGYSLLQGVAGQHLFCFSIGFYIFSFINIYILEKWAQPMMLIHHFVVSSFLLYVASHPEFPAFYTYVLIPQVTAAVYHTHLVLKETKGASQKHIAFWYDMNFYTWLFFRFVVYGIFSAAALYLEFTYFKLPLVPRVIMIAGLAVGYFFNIYWLLLLLKKRRMKRKSALA